jgi:lipopolysaccharide export system permease protein
MLVSTGRNIAIQQLELGKPEALESLEGRVTELSTTRLAERARLRHEEGAHSAAREAEIEAQGRVSFPLAALVFAMVGAPLGVQRTRSGKGMGFGFSVLITFVYWTTVQIFQAIGKGGGLPALAACQIPNLVGIGVGIWLIWRVTLKGAVN